MPNTPSHPLLRIAQQSNIDFQQRGGLRLCVAGQAEVKLNHRRYLLRRGSLHLISPLIAAETERVSDDFEELTFLLPLERILPTFQRVVDHLVQFNIPQHPFLQVEEDVVAEYCAAHRAQAQRWRQAHAAASPTLRSLYMEAYDAHFKALMLDTLTRIAATIEPVATTELTVAQRTTNHFLVLLQLNFTRERAVKFYAQELGLSAGHFTTLVKEQTGRTPSEWIATLTMTQARNLLLSRDESIKEVAAQLGFPDQFAFGKYFKLHEGCSPKEYRARAQSAMEGT